jgi:predicted HTH transcriptional regulator
MTALELLESLNLLDENEHIEAKRASEAGKSILETICAFANEPGLGSGWLLLGVVREEQALFSAYEVEGISSGGDSPVPLNTNHCKTNLHARHERRAPHAALAFYVCLPDRMAWCARGGLGATMLESGTIAAPIR